MPRSSPPELETGLAFVAEQMGVSAEMDDLLGSQLGDRLEAELQAALRRRAPNEARLGGALRTLAPFSSRLREAMLGALDAIVHRCAFSRPLYLFILRGLIASGEPRIAPLLARALGNEAGAGLGTIAAAALCRHAEVAAPLAKLALSRSPQIAFAGLLAQATRGESQGRALPNLALRMKESHRLELAQSLALPLVREGCRAVGTGSGFRVLRDAERHLGRWLLFGEVGTLSGDTSAATAAQMRARGGPNRARVAWQLIAWSLQSQREPIDVKPTVDVVARLSDRPSAERDLSFLFRLAKARVASATPLLESLCGAAQLEDENAVRCAGYLLRTEDRPELQRRLANTVRSSKCDNVRGLALAALHGARPEVAASLEHDFTRSRQLQNAVFGSLVRLSQYGQCRSDLLSDPLYRWGQRGWLD